MTNVSVLRGDERAALALRALYSRYGYTQYKMNKFEEYDLYVRNKDFLISDNIITFTDTGGKLMALKPDVTLSIVKNSRLDAGVEKVYYQENVYRISDRSGSFREIMQVGLECIGQVDRYCIFEVLQLAAKSLAAISADTVLDISHLGIVSAVLDALAVDGTTRSALLRCIGEKNLHEMTTIAANAGADADRIALLARLVAASGKPSDILPTLVPALSSLVDSAMLQDFAALAQSLEESVQGCTVHIDFSVVSDMGYYNGIVFKGFVAGVPAGLLSGGEYNGLMKKMGRTDRAIGFAVYLDALERHLESDLSFDVDTVVLYDDSADPAALAAFVEAESADGKAVLALGALPEKLRYRTLRKFDGRGNA
ncbi:MAG: ATP phosphoribosyltransferase regulatory subunit [Clostridia bacterium]|nr:ATP phosphoribosyltransferase regulatory subunit [Clostridia bacterium]